MIFTSRRGFLTGKAALPEKQNVESLVRYPVGKLDLYVLPVEHTYEHWEAAKPLIENHLNDFETVIPEYFPPEYEHLTSGGNPVVAMAIKNFYLSNYLFHETAKLLWHGEKRVYVIDPAYSEVAGAFRLAIAANSSFVESPILLRSFDVGLSALRKALGEKPERLTRREFLLGTGLIGVGATAISTSPLSETEHAAGAKPDLVRGVEADFRRVVIAEHLSRMGDVLEEKALLIYPPAHWNGIKYYLENPLGRAARLFFWGGLRGGYFKDMFIGRQYRRNDFPFDWNLVEKFTV